LDDVVDASEDGHTMGSRNIVARNASIMKTIESAGVGYGAVTRKTENNTEY